MPPDQADANNQEVVNPQNPNEGAWDPTLYGNISFLSIKRAFGLWRKYTWTSSWELHAIVRYYEVFYADRAPTIRDLPFKERWDI